MLICLHAVRDESQKFGANTVKDCFYCQHKAHRKAWGEKQQQQKDSKSMSPDSQGTHNVTSVFEETVCNSVLGKYLYKNSFTG